MKIGIPVIKGKLKVSLKEVDKLNILTKILLHSIELKLSVEEIGRIINFPQQLIKENIEELEKSGIIVKDINKIYQLTEIGKKNLKLLNDIEKFNKQGIEVFIDSYTKHIFEKVELKDRNFEKN